MQFEALYYSERLISVNPDGDVGVATLWSPASQVRDFLLKEGLDLSRVAVIANLYGDGLPQMLRNLLWNPQIKYILALGQDLSGSGREIEALFNHGVEKVTLLGQEKHRIIGQNRVIDPLLPVERLKGLVEVKLLGKLSDRTAQEAREFLANLPPPSEPSRERINIPLPEYKASYFPSEPRSQVILRKHPLDAWEETVFRVKRFGIPSPLSRGRSRLELQNVKVVVSDPCFEEDASLSAYGFSEADFRDYQAKILDPILPEGISYTYGHRLRSYFGRDLLAEVGALLKKNPNSRDGFISLWDSAHDVTAPDDFSRPCLVSLFFRYYQDKLTLTAVFRAHNLMSAWLRNFYGLMAIRDFVAKIAGLEGGAITVISQSLSINPESTEKLSLAQEISDAKKSDDEYDRKSGKFSLRHDANGYFVVTLDQERKVIIAQLRHEGEILAVYEGKSAREIESQIARDNAISEISHALYVGRELGLKEAELKRLS